MTGRPPTRERRYCAECGQELSRATRGEFCFAHRTYAKQSRENRGAALMRYFAHHPHLLAERSRKIAEANRRPERREMARAQAVERKLWKLGAEASSTPEVRARQGRTSSANRLAHIPLERQDDYRILVRKVGAREALRIVMEYQQIVLARGFK